MDPSTQIWTPLPNFPVKHRLNHIWLLVLFASFLSLVSYRFVTFLDNCKISLTNFTIIQTGSSDDLQSPPQPFCPPNYLLFKYLIYQFIFQPFIVSFQKKKVVTKLFSTGCRRVSSRGFRHQSGGREGGEELTRSGTLGRRSDNVLS